MKTFIDSNIIAYANDSSQSDKQSRAIDCIFDLLSSGLGVISTQVLSEYAQVALTKLNQSSPVVIHQLHLLESLQIVAIQPAIVRRAIELKELYQLSFWDSQIIAAAESVGCTTLLSEDLNPGQYYAGLVCENPFK